MGGTIFLAVAVVAFNLLLPLLVRQKWMATRDEAETDGIPTRSIVPLYVGCVLWAGIALVSLLLSDGSPYARGLVYLAFAALVTGVILCATTWLLRWPRWALPPRIREPARVKHDVAVYYVDEEHAGRDGAYYMASCSCGWSGDPSPTQVEADRQARSHQPLSDPPLREFRAQ